MKGFTLTGKVKESFRENLLRWLLPKSIKHLSAL